MRRSHALTFTAIAAMLLVACGARVEPLPQAVGGIPTAGPTGVATGTLAPTDGPVVPGQTDGPGPGPIPTDSPILPNCRGGASDTGVTATTIKLGLIATLTGPLPGQFNSAVEAVDSHFKMINDLGGICGRKVELIIRDDGGDGGTNLRIAEQMAKEHKIFAFVGSHSAPDDSGIAKVSKRDKIPDIGFPLTWERAENPYTYGVPGILQRKTIGEGASGSKYLNEANGIKQIAIFWLKESEVSIMNAWAFEAAMKHATNNEIEICHEQPAGVLDTNFSNYVVAMKGNCDTDIPTAVYSTMENNANINLAKAMVEQQFRPKVYAPTFTSYLPKFIEASNGAAEGAYIAMPQVPVERLTTMPQSRWTPGTYELARYVAALQKYHPNHAPTGSFGGPAWSSAALFVDVATYCGAKLTRECVLDRLQTMGPYSNNGFVSPVAPGARHIYTADLIVQVRDGKFVEIKPELRSGPKGAPDFWDRSELIEWQEYYCQNRSEFPNNADKDRLIDEC